MTHSFNRYTAAGNTFLVMNTWEDPLSLSREEMRTLVRLACDYKTGAGADGMILINQPKSSPLPAGRGAGGEARVEQASPPVQLPQAPAFRMDFYNPDGTTGMLCGNGARCAAQAAKDYGFADSERVGFEVLGAINTAEFLPNGSIRVFFQDPVTIRLNFELPIDENIAVPMSYVDLGSQHVILFWDNDPQPSPLKGRGSLETFDIAHFGSLVRWHPEFAPVGANANFVEVREDGDERYLRIRTYERGVEGETLACGTGCMSAAIVARLSERIMKVPIRLLTQSGEFVTVNFSTDGQRISNLSLEGSVVRGEDGTLLFDEERKNLEIEYS